MKIVVASLVVAVLFSVYGVAQEYTRWGLPEGAKMRLGKGWIVDMKYSPDGTRLAVASSIGIWLYDTETYKEVALLSGHTAPVKRIAFNSNGSVVASWSSDRTARVWSAKSAEHLRTLCVRGHQYGRGAISADGSVLACQFGLTADLWDVQKGELKGVVKELGRATGLAISADGSFIACGNSDGTVHLWNAESGKKLHSLAGHKDEVRIMAFSSVGSVLASGSFDRTVRLWNTKTGDHLGPHFECTDHIASLAFDPKGETLAIGLVNDDVELWKIRDMWGFKKVHKLQRRLTGHGGPVGCLTFHPNGRTLASSSSDGSIHLWNTKTGAHQHTINGHAYGAHSLVYSPDGSVIVSAGWYGDEKVYLWDAVTGTHLHAFAPRTEGVERIVFSPDGRMIASAGGNRDKNVQLWDPKTGRLLRTLTGHTEEVTCAAFSPDGKTLASGSRDNKIRLWDAVTGEYQNQLTGHVHNIYSAAFSPNGVTLASGSGSGKVRLWNLSTGEFKPLPSGHSSLVHSVAFDREGRLLASAGRKQISLWDAVTGECHRTLTARGDRIEKIVLSPGGGFLASWHGPKTVRIWETKTGKLMSTLSVSRHQFVSFTFSPTGRMLTTKSKTNSDDKYVALRDAITRADVYKITGHVGGIGSIAFSPDGSTFASGGLDGTVILWDWPLP